ncbi:Chloroperoxidase [Lipomyces tetrasporus]
MKLQLYLHVATIYGLAAASPWSPEPKGHEYQPARPSDSRSPCPGLNARANHGWLERSGKNIDRADVDYAAVGAFNYAHGTFDGAVKMVWDYNLSTTGNSSTFNLVDLKKHDAIEFDGSLSRNDFYFGDDLHFDPAIWHTVATRIGLYDIGHSEKGKYVTVEVAAKATAARVADAKRVNPTFNASAAEMMGSPGTTALYLTTLRDNAADAAPKSWIRAFFGLYESLPVQLITVLIGI